MQWGIAFPRPKPVSGSKSTNKIKKRSVQLPEPDTVYWKHTEMFYKGFSRAFPLINDNFTAVTDLNQINK